MAEKNVDLREAFVIFDKDGDGKISLCDLAAVIVPLFP